MTKQLGYSDDLLGAPREAVSGPLIGGGATQAGIMAARLLFKGKPASNKWAGLIGGAVGALVSGALMISPRHRATGTSALVTALLIAVPRQIEDLLTDAGVLKDGYFGVVTAEQAAMAGLGVVTAEQMAMAGGYGYDDGSQIQGVDGLQLLGSMGDGLGVTVAEQMSDAPADIGNPGFGSSFLG